MNFENFKDEKVFITGAASGIGKAQAESFLSCGAKVVGFDIQSSTINHTNYEHICGSVTNRELLQTIASKFKATILCNTAGILDGYAKTLETNEELWDQVFNVNVKGMYNVTNAFLPNMVENKKGVIINMASIAGQIAGGGGAAYTASKHAVIGYTKQLSYDYAKEGIRVNAIAPGAIETPMNKADFEGDGEMAKWVAEQTPAGRWAKPEEVAKLTLFLASSAADYIHAAVVPIDGGWMNK